MGMSTMSDAKPEPDSSDPFIWCPLRNQRVLSGYSQSGVHRTCLYRGEGCSCVCWDCCTGCQIHHLRYEIMRSRGTVDEWRVEAIDYKHDGQVFVTIFSGPEAKQRAKEYAQWKSATRGTAREREA